MNLKGLIEFSDRYSKNNVKSNLNPYILDVSSSKKSLKKKSESIDAVILSLNNKYIIDKRY